MTYPASLTIAQGTVATPINTTNYNAIVDQINAMSADLVLARGSDQAFPGHLAPTTIDGMLQALKHMLSDISGETLWYTAPAGTLKAHTHAVGQGGLIPWSSLGISNVRKVELHPIFPGGLITTSLRGSSPSGNNTITITNDVDVVSYVGRHYYDGSSASVSLQDTYIAVRFTLPIDFTAWASSNAIQIEYKTGSALASDCHVDVYIYKSGNGTIVTNSDNNVNVNWSNVGIAGSSLGSWSAGDILELYIKLESRNTNFARIGKIALNYTS